MVAVAGGDRQGLVAKNAGACREASILPLSTIPGIRLMNIDDIARRLVQLCREGKYEQAQDELYADSAVSIEMEGLPEGTLGNAHGLAAIREKGRRWRESIESIHAAEMSDPLLAGNWFSVSSRVDATYKGMGRMDLREIAVYRVREGKVVHEQFFYDLG